MPAVLRLEVDQPRHGAETSPLSGSLLEAPHDGIELKYITVAHLELTGNAYWLLDSATSDMTPPRATYRARPEPNQMLYGITEVSKSAMQDLK